MKRIVMGLAFVATATPLLAQQAAERNKTAAKPEQKICKRSAPSGSLVPTRRECHTQDEWNRIAQSGRAEAQELVDRTAPTNQ